MKKFLAFLFLLVFSASTSFASVQTGAMAPDFTLSGSDGKTYKLSQYKGKTVVLEWLNYGCPFVKKHYNQKHKNMQGLQKKYGGEDIVWLSIISSAEGKQGFSTPEQAEADRKANGAAPKAVLLDKDGKVGKLYDAKTTPHMFVIDPTGKLMYQGAIDDKPTADADDIPGAKNYVAMALDWLIKPAGARTPSSFAPGSTKPYGCSVKY